MSFSLRYYGCGLVVPECLEGCRILDLGSGSGRDCYMLSQLVGEKGHVTGVDMTEDQVLYITITVQCTVNYQYGKVKIAPIGLLVKASSQAKCCLRLITNSA